MRRLDLIFDIQYFGIGDTEAGLVNIGQSWRRNRHNTAVDSQAWSRHVRLRPGMDNNSRRVTSTRERTGLYD